MGRCEWWGVIFGREDGRSEGRAVEKYMGFLRKSFGVVDRWFAVDSEDGEKGGKVSKGNNVMLMNLNLNL